MNKATLQLLAVLTIISIFSYQYGKESIRKEILATHKLNGFYLQGEGRNRVECKVIQQETITRDKVKSDERTTKEN